MQNLALIGLGGWGRRLVESVHGVSAKARFATAVVRRPEMASDFAAAHGLKLETDLAAALRDPAIDGIVSAGPAHLHFEHGMRAIEAGKPVLAIKPMALLAADGGRMRDAARKRNVLLALGYNRCFFPNVVEMRRRLRAGLLGDLLHTEGDFCVDRYRPLARDHWKANPDHSPAGALADHMLYLAIDTLGPIQEVHALAHRHHSDNALADVTAVLLRTQGRQSVLLTAIGVTAEFYRYQVFGTNGWIELRDDRQLTFQPLKGERETLMLDRIDTERAEVEAFCDAISGVASFPVSAEQAAHGVAVIEAMARSANEGRPLAVS